MNIWKKSFIYSCIAGFILYLLETCCSILLDTDIQFVDKWFWELFLAFFLAANILAVYTMLYKNKLLKQMMFRTLVLFLTWFGTFILCAILGIVPFIYKLAGMTIVDDPVSGLLTVIFVIGVFTVCLVTILLSGIVKVSKRIF